jgi:dUTP pyrophosphatase
MTLEEKVISDWKNHISITETLVHLAKEIDKLNSPITLKIDRLDSDVKIPTKANDSDICFDVYAHGDGIVTKRYIEYRTGFRMEIPEGYGVDIFARSSISNTDLILSNSVGIVDTGYRGEWIFKFKVIPFIDNPIMYKDGERIGQFRLYKKIQCNLIEGYVSKDTDRGTGGFGSSGK